MKYCLPFFLFLFKISFNHAIFEDQIGKFDWKKSFVGALKFSIIEEGRVYVASEDNVIAALSTKAGSIIWRQVLEVGDRGSINLIHKDRKLLYSVCGTNIISVRGFDPKSGVLVSQWSFTTSPLNKLEENAQVFWFVHEKFLYRVVIFLTSRVEVISYNLNNGLEAPKKIIQAKDTELDDKCALSQSTLGCLNKDGRVMLVSILAVEGRVIEYHHKYREKLKESTDITSANSNSELPAFAFTLKNHSSCVILFGDDLETGSVDPPGTNYLLEKNTDVITRIVITQAAEELKSRLLVSGTRFVRNAGNSKIQRESVEYTTTGAGKLRIVGSYCKPNSATFCNLLLTWDNHVSTFLKFPGVLLWERQEALAKVLDIEMIELPMSEAEAAIQAEFDHDEEGLKYMFLRRINMQFLQLYNQSVKLMSDIRSSFSSLNDANPPVELVRDKFNLHKIIIVTTEVGKIFGIDNLSGEILWSYQLQGVVPFSSSSLMDKLNAPIYVQRGSRHFPHAPLCTVLYQDEVAGTLVLFSFNPITGESSDGVVRMDYKLKLAMLLPNKTDDYISGLLLVDTDHRAHLHPEHTSPILKRIAPSLFYYMVDAENGYVSGYVFPRNLTEFKLIRTWMVRCPDKILSIAAKNPEENVHSQGRVLPDRNVIYKYLNPNMIAIVSETTTKDGLTGVLLLQLLDVVSGDVLYADTHHRATYPVSLVHSENWMVFTYFNEKLKRTEVAAYEFYEAVESEKNKTVITTNRKKQNTTAKKETVVNNVFSSFNRLKPVVESKGFVLPITRIEAVRETITEKGIANKNILIASSTGFVLELPRTFLDPRRSLNMTQEMREDGILPYLPEIPVLLDSVINYNQTLHRIKGIHTAPTSLESTCLVFVHGLDLFFTRVAPSRSFDLLKDDFDYTLISVVLGALVATSYFVKHFAYKKSLNQAWK